MNTLNRLFTTATIALFVTYSSSAQILGGRENSQSSPKVAEASRLNGGTFTGDVNTMTGQYNASVPLGSVSTPGGLSFTLNMNHNSSFSLGTNEPMSSGLSYGEGWSLSLPTISVETDVFHRFGAGPECLDNDGMQSYNSNTASSDYLGSWEGDLFWFAPTVNIPGVGGGRAVFKYVDASTGDAIFVLNTFETPIEIVLSPTNGWMVKLADGTIYHFGAAVQQYRAPANKRLLHYEHTQGLNATNPDQGSMSIVEDTFAFSPDAISNTIEPKQDYSVWYCDLITNKNLFGQAIHFEYEKYGEFNLFAEFQQPNYRYVHKEIFQDASLGYLPDYTAYRDILLKSVTSYVVDETPVDILELEYRKLTEAYSGGDLLNPDTDPDVYMVDDLYCAKVVYPNDESDFSGWKRYKHINRDKDNENNIDGSNPYRHSSGNYYFREGISGNEAAFNHGFLESPRLQFSEIGGAGDLFEIRTRIVRPDGQDLVNGNGTIDIAVVTSDGPLSGPYTEAPNGSYPSGTYTETRGEEVFSTFNMALKWQMGYGQSGIETSNFFVMPNIPENFGGINIQVGPGNSDLNYSYYDTELFHTFDPAGNTTPPNALAAYPQLYGFPGLKSAATIPHKFGTGHPWGMMAPIYNHMARSNGTLNFSAAHHESLYIGSWWMKENDDDEINPMHNPTKFNEEVKLVEFELIRYSKIAYMLRGVKQYKINGEYNKSIEDEGKKLISQKRLDYTVEYANRIRNRNYQQGQPLEMEPNSQRQIILLSAIHEVPVESQDMNIYASNFDVADPTVVLSTKLEYENILPVISGTIYFDQLKPYQGLVHYSLVKFIDHLGGETNIEYYPVDSPQTRLVANANLNWSACGSSVNASYGSNKVYTLHPAVKYISKFVENYSIATGQYINPVRRWEYVYDLNSKIYNVTEMYIPVDHFRGHFLHGGDIAFGKVTVYSPALADGTRNYTVHEFFGKLTSSGSGFGTTEEFLYYGKPKSVKEYDHNNVLHSSVEYQYDYTLAFENGYKRPNFMREGIGYYDHPLFRDYEYKDYYLDEEMSVDDPNGPGTLTGHEAKIILAPNVLKEGGGMMEAPKFLPLYFFNELLGPISAANVNGEAVSGTVTNPVYFFNSYFVKKTAEINRTYEDGLSKAGITVAPADPVFDYIESNPFGTGVVNPVRPDPQIDDALVNKIRQDGDSEYTTILNAAPLSDVVLEELVISNMSSENIVNILLTHSGGFSDNIWTNIIDKQKHFSPAQLHQLVYHQPYFTDNVQRYLIQNAGTKYDDKFYQALLLRNPKLSDNAIKDLTTASYIPGESFDVVLSGQTHNMNAALLTNIIRSANFNSTNYLDILTDQWLTENHYNDLTSGSLLNNEAITVLIEQHYVKPTDATLEDFIHDRNPNERMVQRIINVIDRPLSSSLTALLEARYPGRIHFPINVNPLNQYCGNAVNTNRIYIETKTEYEYYEADYRGVAQGKAFELLLGKINSVDEPSAYPLTIQSPQIGPTNLVVPHLQLKHEPSWQVFSVKTSSPHQPGAFNREEYFYFYDLQNRYDRIWHNYDQNSADLEYIVYDSGDLIDTLFTNYNYTSYYTSYPPLVPAFDGMAGARENNMRSTAFQKTTFSKNTRDSKALRSSEYYDYDRRWEMSDKLTPTNQFQTENIDTEPCPTPTSYPCDDCIYANHVFSQDQIDLYVAEGYCVWEATPGSGYEYDYYACPTNVTDMTPCDSTAVLIACPDDPPGGTIPGSGMIVFGKALSKSLQLREVIVQVDTIDVSGINPFDDYKVDAGNTYIAEFKMGNPEDPDANGFGGGEYEMITPHTSLTVRTIDERNRHLQPLLEHNQVNLKTRYYYDNLIRKRYVSDDCPLDNYDTKINTNIGLAVRITVGYGRADSLSTAYEYTDAGQVKKVTEPSGKFMEYIFDGFQRMQSVTENGTRLLRDVAYHQWNNNETQDFYERAQENYVQTKTYNSANSGDFQWQRAYMDPLGRTQSAVTSYFEGSTIYHTYSGSTVHDNWDRTIRMHKNTLMSASFDPVNDTYNPASGFNYGMTYSDSYYENTPKKRSRETANFGVNINDPANHTVRSNYAIANNVYTSCELGVSLGELPQIMGPGSTSAFRFYRSEVFDQDNKQSVEYTNALGQKVGTIKYNDNNEKLVTLFVYDSYGNLTKVINPKKQHADYSYNILGQLYQERSVDAGLKKYMYNKQGKVSVTLDQQGWNRVNDVPEDDPFYRVHAYDIYGRLLRVGRSAGPDNYWKRATYGPLHYQTKYVGTVDGYPLNYDETSSGEYFDYLFTNGSTQDWLCTYDVWGWLPPVTSEPIKVTIKDLYNRFQLSEQEKGYVYGTNTELSAAGKIKETHSYNNQGAMIQKTVYTYDNLENIATQTVYFNPDQSAGTLVFPNPPSVIEYPVYNYQKALLEEKVDVDGNNVVDLHYFYEYDKLNRLKGVYAAKGEVNGMANATLLVSYEHDDANGVILKKTHSIDHDGVSVEAVETNYYYDTRDRLTNVHAINKLATSPVSLMQYALYYDNQQPYYGFGQAEPLQYDENWNGNINGTLMSYNFNETQDDPSDFEFPLLYGYTYDKINRLTMADAMVGDFIAGATQEQLNESFQVGDVDISYDKIGNILSLLRHLRSQDPQEMMELQHYNYQYATGTNRLFAVQGLSGTLGRTYSYDENGNLLTDSFRDIDATQYGRAAYAYEITQDDTDISYLYSVDDQRMYKKVKAPGETKREYYLMDAFGKMIALHTETTPDGIQFNSEWEYYAHGSEREARLVTINGGTRFGTDEVSFFINDHLGNTRINYTPHIEEQQAATNVLFDDQFLGGSLDNWGTSSTGTIVNSGGSLTVSDASNVVAIKNVNMTAGNTYVIELNIDMGSMSSLGLYISGNSIGALSSGMNTFNYTPVTSGSFGLIINSGAGGSFGIKGAKLTENVPNILIQNLKINSVIDYYPYGKVLREYVNGEEERYLTTQHERDRETGLDYRGARYYDCDVARFLSLDPHASKYPSISAYNYVAGNPIIITDPDGKDPNPLMWIADGFRRFFAGIGSVFSGEAKAEGRMTKRKNSSNGGDAVSGEVYGGARFSISSQIQEFFTYGPDNADLVKMSATLFEGKSVKMKKGTVSYEMSTESDSDGNSKTTERASGQYMINGVPVNAEVFKITDKKGNVIDGGSIGVGTSNKKLYLQLQEDKAKLTKTLSVGGKLGFESPSVGGVSVSGKVEGKLNYKL